jgi:hypothetical protein
MTFQNLRIREHNIGKTKLILTKIYYHITEVKKVKAIPVTGCEGP